MPSTENINININSNFQTVNQQSTDMRKQIRELRKEFYSLEEGTEEYNSVLERLSKLQLDYSDATIVMRNSANDLGQRLTNLVKVSGDLMSGFSAAQGALALFGVESENFENIMIRLQAAIAIVQGLEGLEGMIDHMKALKASFSGILRPVQSFITMISNWVKFGKQATTVTQAQAAATTTLTTATGAATVATGGLSAAMVALRTALISTGIGALVVAIGAAVAALVNWISTTNRAKEEADAFAASVDTMLDSINSENSQIQQLDEEYQKLTGTYNELQAANEKVSKAEENRATILRTLTEAEDRLNRESNKKAKETLQQTVQQLKDAYEEANTAVSIAYRERRNIQKEEQNKTLEEQEKFIESLKKAYTETTDVIFENDPLVQIAQIIREYYRQGNILTDSFVNSITSYEEFMTAAERLQFNTSRDLVEQLDDLAERIGMNGPLGVSLEEFQQIFQNIHTAILSMPVLTEDTVDYFNTLMDQLAAKAKSTATEIQAVTQPDLSGIGVSENDVTTQTNQGVITRTAAEERFNQRMMELAAERMKQSQEEHDSEASEMEDLTNRRIALLQQYSQLYMDSMASLFSENEYFDDWMNSMNNAFSGISEALGNITSQFANFFNEKTGEIDFSEMEWEDWASTATMAIQGVSSILGTYASNYKDQMEQVLESDTATEEEKLEAVKKYKNMLYAQTAIDMFSGMTAAVATAMQLGPIAGPILGGINAAMVLASGIASLNQIKQMDPTTENNVSGTGSSTGGTPNVSTAIDSDAYTNTLSAQSQYDLQAGKAADTRVYVLESDIQKTTNDVNVKVNESTF